MTEAILIFALVFFAAAFAFLAWEADAWVRKQRRYRARYEAPEIKPVPFAPAYELDHAVDALRCAVQSSFPSNHFPAGYWYTKAEMRRMFGPPPNPARFQHFAADSADEKGAWGPTA